MKLRAIDWPFFILYCFILYAELLLDRHQRLLNVFSLILSLIPLKLQNHKVCSGRMSLTKLLQYGALRLAVHIERHRIDLAMIAIAYWRVLIFNMGFIPGRHIYSNKPQVRLTNSWDLNLGTSGAPLIATT